MRQEKSSNHVRQPWGGRLVTGLLCLVSFILALSFFILLASFIYGTRVMEESAPPPLLGNKPETIALLETDNDNVRPFTFWVAGDPHKEDYLRILYPEQIKPQHPSFGIILGDVVLNPLKEQHQYFWRESRRWGIDSPVLMVIGNHDVVEGYRIHDPDRARRAFNLEEFHDAYGPDEFSFKYAGCLFIFLNDILEGEAYVDFLKETLEKEASSARMIFVFCHIPIRTDHPLIQRKIIDVPGFADLVKRYRVDYVISGHYHSYVRQTLAGTTYLISGGGTGLGERESMLLSHGIFFDVDPASRTVSERVMVVHEGICHYILYHLNYFAAHDFTPFIKSYPFQGIGCFAVNLLLLVWVIIRIVRRSREKDTISKPPKQ